MGTGNGSIARSRIFLQGDQRRRLSDDKNLGQRPITGTGRCANNAQISGTQAGWAKNQCGHDEEIFADGSLGRGPCHRGAGFLRRPAPPEISLLQHQQEQETNVQSLPFLLFHPAQSAPIGSTTSNCCVSPLVVIMWEGQSNSIV